MYAWIWKHLPGPIWLKVLEVAVLVAAVVLLLFTVVFPAVEAMIPLTDGTVGAEGGS